MTYQLPLLAVPPKPLTPSQRETLRRYGSLEVQGVRLMRLARQRRAHEQRKASEATPAFSLPRLTLQRAFGTTGATKRNAQAET